MTASAAKLKKAREKVVAYVQETDCVSFVQIERLLEDTIPIEGNRELYFETNENIILWSKMSPEFMKVIQDLRQEKRIFAYSAQPLIYLIDGKYPQWPVAHRSPKGGYKKPHWLPIYFRTVPPQTPAKLKSAH